MTRSDLLHAVSLAFLASSCLVPMAQAQCNLAGSPETGLRVPLVNDAPFYPPDVAVTNSPPEIPGMGSTPAPVTPGMFGPPTLIPSVLNAPANMGGSSFVLPYSPATVARPGQLGPSLCVPPPPSTQGMPLGMINAPMDFYAPPAAAVPITGGPMPNLAPTQRWGGQRTRDFGFHKVGGTQTYDYGDQLWAGQNSLDGPFQQLPGAVPTQDLYGERGYARGGATVLTIAPH